MGIALISNQVAKPKALKLDLNSRSRILIDFCIRQSKYLLVAADMLFLFFFFSLAANSENKIYLVGITFLITLWAFVGFFKQTYTLILIEDAEIIIRRTFYHWLTFSSIGLILYSFLFKEIFNNKIYLLSLLLTGVVIFIFRVIFLSIRKKYKYLIIRKRKIAIIGNNIYSKELTRSIHEGYNKDEIHLYSDEERPFSDIHSMAQKGIREIYCCLSALDGKDLKQLLEEADRYMIRVRFFPDDLLLNERLKIKTINKVPIYILRPEPLQTDKHKLMKRSFDVCFSLFVLVFILSWLTPLLWLIIRLESKGPVFFRQKRTGMDNREFYCYKFRSMVYSNSTSDSEQASRNDQRVTRIGAFLRKTSIDELPQFFNVLRGDMSVVGPRPHMLLHTDQYRRKIEKYMIRHYVKPGITGLAQINGFRGGTEELIDMQLRLEHDIEYVENWTFLLDMKIIFLTIWNLFHPDKNAY